MKSIYNNTRALNVCKKNKIEYREIKERNGYGMKIVDRVISDEDYRVVMAILESKPQPKVRSYEQKLDARCRRLSKLACISVEEAQDIALEKEEYHEEKIEEIEERQSYSLSRERDKLINKMRRENPLRYIKNTEHAKAIVAASNRHRYTNYESQLEEARELAMM